MQGVSPLAEAISKSQNLYLPIKKSARELIMSAKSHINKYGSADTSAFPYNSFRPDE